MAARIGKLVAVREPAEKRDGVLICYCHKCGLTEKRVLDTINGFRTHEVNGARCLELNEYQETHSGCTLKGLYVMWYVMSAKK